MSAGAVNMDVPTPLGAERPSVLEIDVVDFARHILYESDLHYGLSVGRVATLLGYDGNPSFKVEMPFRHEHNGDKQVYKPADLDLTYSPDDHLSGFTGLIVGATNIDVVTRVKLVEEIVSVASTTRFEPELTEAAMSARHARHLVMEQIDGMLAVAEFRRRSQ